MRAQGAGLWQAALLACMACGHRSAPASAGASLEGDAARVGRVALPVSLVVQVARARTQTTRDALYGLVRDALLAQGAKAAGLDAEPSVAWTSTAAIARRVPERLYEGARMRGEPIDDDLASLRVIHAVVLRSPTLQPARALEVAETILKTASGARTGDDFEARIKELPHPGAQVIVERLPEFDVSGHTEDGTEFDATFAAAAFGLRAPGDTSGIVETPFGWHVIRLLERPQPDPSTLDRRRIELANAVVEMRVRRQISALLRDDRKRTRVEISASADQLMAEATGGS